MASSLWLPPEFDWKAPDYAPVFAERARRLEALRSRPEDLPALKLYYKEHPAQFIHDWGFTIDPRNAEIGEAVVIPFLLFPRQEQCIDWLLAGWLSREDGLVEKSRDMGVSWLCVAFGVWMWLFYPGVVVGFGSRKEEYVDKIGDPKSLFWKARQFINLLPAEFRPRGWDEKKHAPHMRVLNPETQGSLVGEAGDNIGRGNRTSIYFVDESAHLEHAEAVDAALSQTTNCRVDVSTPNGAGNSFYRKRHGGRIKVFVFDWKDDPRKDKDWYRKQVETKDPVVVAQEIDRDYEASTGDAWIPGDLVEAAQRRGPADVQAIGGLRVGVDVARFGDDKTVISFRRGRVLLRQEKLKKLDVTQVAGAVHEHIRAFKGAPLEQIAVDTIGIGAGVADILRGFYPDRYEGRNVRKIVVDVNSSLRMGDGKNYNLRAWMAREVKEWLKTASIPNDPDLRSALTSLKYKFKGGELLLWAKEELKAMGIKSPDEYDSLACTFAQPSIVEEEPPREREYTPRVRGVM
jgi:phage terminase large subunit